MPAAPVAFRPRTPLAPPVPPISHICAKQARLPMPKRTASLIVNRIYFLLLPKYIGGFLRCDRAISLPCYFTTLTFIEVAPPDCVMVRGTLIPGATLRGTPALIW